ncbi:hypothetical protein QFZ42_001781 [Variovorax paradoxus]|uniref:hypothetical protein n=1 Tax=Variovorax paradoxus TaxID=34073 RepID=UPI0027943B72|nr:hypothetical protein [Variovorax paradoxus]MDQ0569947.1 hypothetical protein [Variovorax paradoxus]
MLKKTLNAADLAQQIEMHYMCHSDVVGSGLLETTNASGAWLLRSRPGKPGWRRWF